MSNEKEKELAVKSQPVNAEGALLVNVVGLLLV